MFAWMRTRPPFDVDSKRLELLRKLNEIPGIELPESALLGKPAIPLSTFATPGSLGMLFEVCDWFIAEVSG
jgi:hypothetical protein